MCIIAGWISPLLRVHYMPHTLLKPTYTFARASRMFSKFSQYFFIYTRVIFFFFFCSLVLNVLYTMCVIFISNCNVLFFI